MKIIFVQFHASENFFPKYLFSMYYEMKSLVLDVQTVARSFDEKTQAEFGTAQAGADACPTVTPEALATPTQKPLNYSMPELGLLVLWSFGSETARRTWRETGPCSSNKSPEG